MSKSIARRLLSWYARHGRKDLPWKSGDPYHVWLSEIMLQQTQVATVIPYFRRFIARFPTIRALARANVDTVLHQWSGLGYYARARNLHRAAKVLVAEHGGRIPRDFEAVANLPGIGRSTAGAIVAQAYGQRYPILDGNAKRVLARYHAIDEPLAGAAIERRLWALADHHTPLHRIADYTQAIMDLGATVCRSAKPQCQRCPLRADCAAHAQGAPQLYPRRRAPRRLRTRSVHMLLIRDGRGRVLLQRRPPSGIWGGLWSLPQCHESDVREWARTKLGLEISPQPRWKTLRHTFSHFHLDIHPIPARLLNGGGQLMGEPELSRTHLAVQGCTNARERRTRRSGATCVRAGDAAQDVPISRKHMDVRERSPATDGRAGAYKSEHVAPRMAGTAMERPDIVWYNCRKPDERGLAAPVRRLLGLLQRNI